METWWLWHLPSRFVSLSYTLLGVNGEPIMIAELMQNAAAAPPSSDLLH